jgi:DNA/RNA endonuclease YhcR with UshA esterase domain
MKQLLTTLILLLSVGSLFSQTTLSITEARSSDANGILTNLGTEVVIEGKAIGTNYNPAGQTFAIYSAQEGIGISVYSESDALGYTFSANDNLRITGTLDQFRGLAQIAATSIEVLQNDGTAIEPRATTVLDENTESALVTFRNATVVDPANWRTDDLGSGFNLQMTNGTETITVRIDSDTDIAGMAAPTGTFDITGLGGQFDAQEPLDEGYQLLPRSISDINPYNTDGGGGGNDPMYRVLTMPEVRMNDANGIPSLNDELVEVTATVYGLNRRDGGLQFTIIDDNNVGVGIFNFDNDFGYTVAQGDMVTVQGTLGHFNGLTQITPDTIMMISSDNPLVSPRVVTELDESTESSLVVIEPVDVEDATQWAGNGGNFNVNFISSTGATTAVRIEDQTEISNVSFPGTVGTVYQGIGGQFDNNDPRDEGYQLLPRDLDDIIFVLNTQDQYQGAVSIYPNPSESMIHVKADDRVLGLELFDLQGRSLAQIADNNTMDASVLNTGAYLLVVTFENGVYAEKVFVK